MNASLPLGKVIAHVDLDAFYAQVEAVRDQERFKDKPLAVIQYNPHGDLRSLAPSDDRLMNDSAGSIIAVNYIARPFGVKRNMRGDEARGLCPDLQLVQVPTAHGKADLTLYRNSGKEVVKILSGGGGNLKIKVEKASIDECYLDLTEAAHQRLEECGGQVAVPVRPHQIHIYSGKETSEEEKDDEAEEWYHRPADRWQPGERLLAAGAAIVAELRLNVENQLSYTLSAGVSHSMLLAKLCSGLHKPAQQTVLPACGVASLLAPLPLGKLKGLGGNFGVEISEKMNIETVGELAQASLAQLEKHFGEKDGQWLYELCQGVDGKEVEDRKQTKSIGCGKTFHGATALTNINSIHQWLLELAAEVEERTLDDREENKRVPQLLTVHIGSQNSYSTRGSVSRSCQVRKIEAAVLAEDAKNLIQKWVGELPTKEWQITSMFLSVSNFVPVQSTSITKFFKSAPTSPAGKSEMSNKVEEEQEPRAAEKEGKKKEEAIIVYNGVEISEITLAELPLDIQKEIRTSAKIQQLAGGGGSSLGGKGRGQKRTDKSIKDLFSNKRSKK